MSDDGYLGDGDAADELVDAVGRPATADGHCADGYASSDDPSDHGEAACTGNGGWHGAGACEGSQNMTATSNRCRLYGFEDYMNVLESFADAVISLQNHADSGTDASVLNATQFMRHLETTLINMATSCCGIVPSDQRVYHSCDACIRTLSAATTLTGMIMLSPGSPQLRQQIASMLSSDERTVFCVSPVVSAMPCVRRHLCVDCANSILHARGHPVTDSVDGAAEAIDAIDLGDQH